MPHLLFSPTVFKAAGPSSAEPFPLLKRDVSDNERDLLSLPAKLGGLGIFNPAERALSSFSYSEALCFPLISLVLKQADCFDPSELQKDQNNIRALQDLDIDYNYVK